MSRSFLGCGLLVAAAVAVVSPAARAESADGGTSAPEAVTALDATKTSPSIDKPVAGTPTEAPRIADPSVNEAGSKTPPPAAATPAPVEKPAAKPAEPALNRARIFSLAIAESPNASLYAAKIGVTLDTAVRRSKRFDVVDSVARLDPVGSQERAEAAQKAADALNLGLKSYRELENGLGLEWFDRALGAYRDSALWDKENIHGFSQALMMRIVVKWSDDPGATRREITNLLTIDPKVELPKDLVPPPSQDLMTEFQRQRDAIAAAATTTIEVASRPVSARVYIDGEYRGTTPASISKVVVGEHLVSIIAPGYGVVQRQMRLTPGDTLSEELKQTDKGKQITDLMEVIRKNWDKPAETDAEKKLASMVDAGQVMIALVSRHEGLIDVRVHRVRASDGHGAGCADSLGLSESDRQLLKAVGEAVERSLNEEMPLCDGHPCPCKAPPPSGPFGAIVGTGVSAAALLATGVTLAVIAKMKADAFNKLPQTDPNLRARGNEVLTYAIPADVCNGLGLITAGVWAYLAFGTSYARHADIQASPIDTSSPAPTRTRPEDDPFEAMLPSPAEAPAWTFAAVPEPGGLTLSLQGAF